jgi:hypothetical protein
MLQTDEDRLPHHPPVTDDLCGIAQHQAAHQASPQMAIVGMFAVHPAGPGRQPGLQGPNTGRNPTATLSPPHAPRRPDGCFETHHGALLLTGRPDHDAGHRARRPTGGPQPCRAHPRDLWAVTPGPLRLRRHVTPLHVRYNCARMALPISTPASARRIGIGRVGDDL